MTNLLRHSADGGLLLMKIKFGSSRLDCRAHTFCVLRVTDEQKAQMWQLLYPEKAKSTQKFRSSLRRRFAPNDQIDVLTSTHPHVARQG